MLAVCRLVRFHLQKYGATGVVCCRQVLQVTLYMALNLALGFGDEPEADGIAGESSHRPDQYGAAIPEGPEYAGFGPQIAQSLSAPDEMIALFTSGAEQKRTYRGVGGNQSLAVIQRLGRDFTGVIDAHQARRMAFFGPVEHCGRATMGGWGGSAGGRRAAKCTLKRMICNGNKPV